jgi:septum formation protein
MRILAFSTGLPSVDYLVVDVATAHRCCKKIYKSNIYEEKFDNGLWITLGMTDQKELGPHHQDVDHALWMDTPKTAPDEPSRRGVAVSRHLMHIGWECFRHSRAQVCPMPPILVLASASNIRRQLLENANLDIEVSPARIDEDAIKAALMAEGAPPRDIADALAEAKARKVSARFPDPLVLGCDQVLAHDGKCLSKPRTPEEALAQLTRLRGGQHRLLSAAVIYQGGEPLWRHVGSVRLTMRDASDAYIDGYVRRNCDSIRHSVGAYKLEEEGVRLFTRIDGDYFTVLGLPLLELLSYLTLRGDIEG